MSLCYKMRRLELLGAGPMDPCPCLCSAPLNEDRSFTSIRLGSTADPHSFPSVTCKLCAAVYIGPNEELRSKRSTITMMLM